MFSMLFLLGLSTGMRTMTPIAVMCWFAWAGMIPQTGWAAWSGSLASAIVFTLLALGEYVGDTLPRTPHRTAPGPMISRLAFGMLCGALASASMQQPLAGGIIFSGFGALVGTYSFHWLRATGSRKLGKDLPVALAESALSLAIAVSAAYGIYGFVLGDAAGTAERALRSF